MAIIHLFQLASSSLCVSAPSQLAGSSPNWMLLSAALSALAGWRDGGSSWPPESRERLPSPIWRDQTHLWCAHPDLGGFPLCCSPQLRCVLHPLSEVSCVCMKIALHEMGEEVEQWDGSLARDRKYLQFFQGILIGFLLEGQYLICIFVCWSLYLGCPALAQLRSDLGSDPSRDYRDLLCHCVS